MGLTHHFLFKKCSLWGEFWFITSFYFKKCSDCSLGWVRPKCSQIHLTLLFGRLCLRVADLFRTGKNNKFDGTAVGCCLPLEWGNFLDLESSRYHASAGNVVLKCWQSFLPLTDATIELLLADEIEHLFVSASPKCIFVLSETMANQPIFVSGENVESLSNMILLFGEYALVDDDFYKATETRVNFVSLSDWTLSSSHPFLKFQCLLLWFNFLSPMFCRTANLQFEIISSNSKFLVSLTFSSCRSTWRTHKFKKMRKRNWKESGENRSMFPGHCKYIKFHSFDFSIYFERHKIEMCMLFWDLKKRVL